MAGMGTGSPISFLCPKHRRQYWKGRTTGGHVCRPTGVTKPYRRKLNQTDHIRHIVTCSIEYRCSCGHVGWSRHVEMAAKYHHAFPDRPKLT